MSKELKIDFKNFLKKFPSVEMPVTISDEVSSEFSKINDPLPMPLIDQYILTYEEVEPDDLTEYVACLRIPETNGFFAIIYGKASLMNYQYIFLPFQKTEN